MDETAARRAFEDALGHYEQAFDRFFLLRLLGLEVRYEGETCVIAFEPRDFLFNPQGSMHGGILAVVMDISMGHLQNHLGTPGITLEMKTQYVKPATRGRLTCTGRFLRRGRGISYLSSELVDESGELLAFATATWKAWKPASPAADAAT